MPNNQNPQPMLGDLQKNKRHNLLYRFIVVAYVIIIIALFIVVTQFLSSNARTQTSLNPFKSIAAIKSGLPGIYFLAGKLGFIKESNTAKTNISTSAQQNMYTDISEPNSNNPYQNTAQVAENKTELKIAVLNSTPTNGLAAALKDQLISAGFKVEKIGNFVPLQETTTIKAKANVLALFSNSLSELRTIVNKSYKPDETQITSDADIYDITIIIGEK